MAVESPPRIEQYPGDTTFRDHQKFQGPAEEKLLRNIIGDLTITDTGYAWGKTARIICEPSYLNALQNTNGTFVAVDLCSSYPWWPQILRERHLEACYEKAQDIVGEAVVSVQAKQNKLPKDQKIPAVENMDEASRKKLRIAISDRHSKVRKYIQAVVQEVLHNPPEIDNTREDAGDELAKLIETRLIKANIEYNKKFELDQLVGRGRWQIMYDTIGIRTLKQRLDECLGEDQASAFLTDLSSFLGQHCLPLLRRHHVFSLDLETSAQILEKAKGSFPKYLQDTDFFTRAGQMPGKHIQTNVLALPFERDSVSYYSCVEGYPYYFDALPLEAHLNFADRIADLEKTRNDCQT